jgi:tetratricopeptide (TPR) repeat protein
MRPFLPTGWLWFLVLLLPVIGLLQAGDQAYAERYAYLSIVGVLVAAVWSLPSGVPGGAWRLGAGTALALLVVLLATLSHRQSLVWRDTATLTAHALERYPSSVIVRAIRGKYFFGKRDYDGAIHELLLILHRLPELASARYNLALVLEARGDFEAAIHHLERAAALAPGEEVYRRLLGEWTTRRAAAAADAATYAYRVQRDPGDLEARRELGAALFELGRFEEAVREFRAALGLAPGQADIAKLLDRAARYQPNGEEQAFRMKEITVRP